MSSIEYINSVTLTSSAASVQFNNIPNNYQDLVVTVFGTSTGSGSEWYMWPNSDSASNETKFSRTYLAGTGSSAISGRQNPGNNGGFAASIGWATNAGVNTSIVQIMNYSSTSMNKTSLVSMNLISSVGYVTEQINLYLSTSPISSLLFGLYTGQDFAARSTFTLWGIK